MKKLTLLGIILIASTSFAQNQVERKPEMYPFATAGFDIKNAFTGSDPTGGKPAFNGQIKLGAVNENWNTEIYLQYEAFPKINYQNYGIGANLLVFPFPRVDAALGMAFGQTIRSYNETFFSYDFNGEIRYDLVESGRYSIGIQLQVRRRIDLEVLYDEPKGKYMASGFANFRIRLN